MRIAVLGTGIMGAPIARNLATAGHEVVAWNRTREKAEGLGAEVADTPAEAAAGADTVLTMLSDGPAVEAVIPDLKPDQLWIQMSTVGVADTERFAARHERYVDSPVLGSLPQAEAAELLALGAGRERPDEVYEAISNNVLWLGDEPGAGTRLKLTINLWIINLVENLVECWVMAEALGLDPTKFLEAIKGRAMDSTYAHLKGQKIIDDEYSAVFSVRNAAKDVRLAIEAAKSAGVDLGLGPVTLERFERAIELGHGDDDTAAAWFASRPA